jgi:predicted ABC-type ATPase
LVKAAQDLGYKVTLLFIWIDSPATAIQRVAERVVKGGHDIPSEVINRRYYRGLSNLINLYIPICDIWMVVNNETVTPEPVAEGGVDIENIIINEYIWNVVNDQAKRNEDR